MTNDTKQPPEPPTQRRSRARRNVIGRSSNRDEYVRLMENGWSSLTLERYAAYRYGEEIPASTFRTYRSKHEIVVKNGVKPMKGVEPDQVVDVIGKRAELIRLQEARIAIDVQHETMMAKLFGSTRGEIATLNALLDSHKADLQDLGLLPKAGEKITINDGRQPTAADAPKARTLGDLLGAPGADPAMQSALARSLHLATRNGVAVPAARDAG